MRISAKTLFPNKVAFAGSGSEDVAVTLGDSFSRRQFLLCTAMSVCSVLCGAHAHAACPLPVDSVFEDGVVPCPFSVTPGP